MNHLVRAIILALSITCIANVIKPVMVITSQMYMLACRHSLCDFNVTTNMQMNRISDFMIVERLNTIAFAKTYSFFYKIVLKLKKHAQKSHSGHNAKYKAKP